MIERGRKGRKVKAKERGSIKRRTSKGKIGREGERRAGKRLGRKKEEGCEQ